MSTVRAHGRSIFFTVALVACGALGLGVGQSSSVRADDAARPVPTASGADVFAQNCVTCHGPRGDGDGPASPGLTPKPRKLSSKDIMSKISDDTIIQTIKKGGAARGLSPLMPPFAQFDDATAKSLVAHIRSLCGCKYTP